MFIDIVSIFANSLRTELLQISQLAKSDDFI